jgi:hypothetical protein
MINERKCVKNERILQARITVGENGRGEGRGRDVYVFMVQERFFFVMNGEIEMYVYPVQQKRRSTSDPDDDEMRCDVI